MTLSTKQKQTHMQNRTVDARWGGRAGEGRTGRPGSADVNYYTQYG